MTKSSRTVFKKYFYMIHTWCMSKRTSSQYHPPNKPFYFKDVFTSTQVKTIFRLLRNKFASCVTVSRTPPAETCSGLSYWNWWGVGRSQLIVTQGFHLCDEWTQHIQDPVYYFGQSMHVQYITFFYFLVKYRHGSVFLVIQCCHVR